MLVDHARRATCGLVIPVLQGRGRERAEIARLLSAVQDGRSATLVLRGEAGIGKTALLEDAVERSEGCRILRAVGVESEMELAFAALHQLCAPLIDAIDRLPPPQHAALATAFGLSDGPPPDRFLLGLAVLSLLADAASTVPLIGVVDDAQWLDRSSAQVLGFVARRLHAESVLLLFAERDQRQPEVLDGLPELRLSGLVDGDARQLLSSPVDVAMDERLRDRIIAEAHGNPLALLELPRRAVAAGLVGAFGLAGGSAPPVQVEASFHARVLQLPEPTQQLLLVAAAEPIGDAELLWRAADRLGIPVTAVEPAMAADLIRVGVRVTFRHPLLRSAIYRGASVDARREVHQALADATDAATDPDRLAWHRAEAAMSPDEAVAEELERAGERARARGGLGAAAAFLERAADLTPDAVRRAGRALVAAEVGLEAGSHGSADRLLTAARAGPLDEGQQARADRVRALLSSVEGDGSTAPALLLAAARRIEPFDKVVADQTYLEALTVALQSGHQEVLRDMAAAISDAAPGQHPRPAELLVLGWARLYADGFPAGTDVLREALAAFDHEPLSTPVEIQGLWFASGVAKSLWDDAGWRAVGQRYVDLTRRSGALAGLPRALDSYSEYLIEAGQLTDAAAMTAEAQAIADAIGMVGVDAERPWLLSAWRNDQDVTSRLERRLADVHQRGDGWSIVQAEVELALVRNSLGQPRGALAAAQRALDHRAFGNTGRALVELVEAAARTGERATAAAAFEELTDRTRLGGTEWSLGLEARLAALLQHGPRAEALHREAIDRLEATSIATEQGRARLGYGEWLRRENRRVDARTHLRSAHELFAGMGAQAFADRARRELMATGETARRAHTDGRDQLTSQEIQIARLAADGKTNGDIAAELYLSPRTIEWHLGNVFTKLGIASRRDLRGPFEARPRY